MSKSGRIFTCMCVLALWLPAISSAQTGEFLEYSSRHWETSFKFDYYQTQANYQKSGGVYESLPADNSYRLYKVDLKARYHLKSTWALFAATQIASAESRSVQATRTNSGFTELLLGTDFLALRAGHIQLIADFFVRAPLVRNDVNSDAVSLSEGVTEAGGHLQAQWNKHPTKLGLATGYVYRDEGRSSLLPYRLFSELTLSSIDLGIALFGFSSVSSDRDTGSESSRTLFANRANAGSLRYFAVNPNLLETDVWLRLHSSNSFTYTIGVGTSLNGTNTAAGWHAFVALNYGFTPKQSKNVKPINTSIDRFQEKTDDGVDQGIFKQQSPVQPTQKPPEDESQTLEEKRRALQEELDKTEMNIRKKSDKKRSKK